MITHRVDFALLLYDEFDGALINDVNVQFTYDGRPITPLRKPDGHYVFGAFEEEAPSLTVQRPRYLPATVRVNKAALPREKPVLPLRLLREHSGYYRDCVWIEGQAPPGAQVLALAPKPSFILRSAQQQEGATALSVSGGGSAHFVGRRFAAENSQDSFIITKMLTLNDFLADAMPKPASGSKPFVRAYLSQSGKDGHFHIPVDECPDGYPKTAHIYDKEKKKWVPVSVTAPC